MNKRRYLLIFTASLLALTVTACGKEDSSENVNFNEETTTGEVIHNPEYANETTTASASTTAKTTTEKTTTKATATKATTTAAKTKVTLSSGSGSQLMSVRKAFTQDGKIYVSGVYLNEGREYTDEDGDVYVDLPEEKDGKTHNFILSENASISFSNDYGPDTVNISAKDFVSKFNAINDGSGVNYTATISGDTITALKFFYIP